MAEDLKEIMDALKETNEHYASQLPPDGDWDPMLFIFKEDTVHMVGFQMPENGWKREKLFMELLPNMINEKFGNPDAVVMLISAWYLSMENKGGWEEGDPIPSESPDRKECLLLHGISRDKELSYMGDIKRGESHPELEWIDHGDSLSEGRLVGCLRRSVWT